MNTDFYKLIIRFTNIIIFILMIISSSTVLFFTIKLSIDESKKKEDNIQLIKEFINSEYSKLSQIKKNIYLNEYFQQDVLDYHKLSAEEYVLQTINRNKRSLYLPETLSTYLDQQNNDDSLVDLILSFKPDYVISTGKSRSSSTINFISFSSKMDFFNEHFPKNKLILQATPKNLIKEIQTGQYYYELSDGASRALLSTENLTLNIPVKTLRHRNITIKIYKDNYFFLKKASLYIGLIYLVMVIFLYIIKRSSKRYFNAYLAQFSDIVTSLNHSNFSNNIRINTQDKTGELKIIAEKINLYYSENEKYIATQREYERLKQRAQFSSLQNQIEPHFLFNNLEFIRMKAVLADEEEISDSIFLLSQLYKNNTYQPDVISLEEELLNIQLFLQLYKYRYANFNFSIHNQIKDLTLPKLALQPFAENYIKHGFIATKKGNFLEISCHDLPEHYLITFKDNGIGISEEKLIYLRTNLLNPYDGKQHIGIKNSLVRLNIHFKDQVELSVCSLENESFSLSLMIQKEVT